MSRLTTREDIIVETMPQDHTLIISTRDAVIMKCTRCGRLKDVSVHDVPTNTEVLNGTLKTGTTDYPWMQQCRCNDANELVDPQHLLSDIAIALKKCRTIEEAQDSIRRLASAEEMRR